MDCNRAKTRNPSEWIELCPDFSRPIAEQLCDWILTWEPDLAESIKWNLLCFSGRKLVCGISACRRHAALTFFRGMELEDAAGLFAPGGENNTSIRSVRIEDPGRINQRALRALLHQAVELDSDPMIPALPKKKRAPMPLPEFFRQALRADTAAAAGFKKMSASCQREYIVWLRSAKRPETRERRLKETLAAVGKGHRWENRKKV